MKKTLTVMLCVIMLLAFSGCNQNVGSQNKSVSRSDGSELPVVKLCVDLPQYDYESVTSGAKDFLKMIPGGSSDFQVEYEIVPTEGAERDGVLTRLRTEIATGKGPDVFICSCFNFGGKQGLFKFPKQAMKNRIFLPLDDYIAGAQYMELDKLTGVVMDAGKGEEGQLILPLAYEGLTGYMFDKSKYELSETLPMKWYEMGESNDNLAAFSASIAIFNNLFGEIADYENDTPAISKDELLKAAQTAIDLDQRRMNGELGGKLWEEEGVTVMEFDIRFGETPPIFDVDAPDYIMVPAYNISGGITANISAFTGINRNTAYPEQSFLLLDLLLSKRGQQSFQIYDCIPGIPVHEELGHPSEPIDGRCMSENNFKSFAEVRDQINAVKFGTPIDAEIDDNLFEAYRNSDRQSATLEKLVSEAYTTMKMMLAES